MPRTACRPLLGQEQIKKCHCIVDELVALYQETDPAKGKTSENNKQEKALQALNKIGLLSAILTEWAENQIFGAHYHLARSKNGWIEDNIVNQHENEIMWNDSELPDDLFSSDNHLITERLAIGKILHNTFGRYGRTGWRLSLSQSLYALNEGQVDWLLTPTNINQKGNAYDLQNLKWAAVRHVYKLKGQGWKKMAAQQKVAESCGTTLNAVKKWEKECIKERDKEKQTLRLIEFGAKFLISAKNELQISNKDALLQIAAYWNINSDSEKDPNTAKNISAGIASAISIDEKYPLESLKERLLTAGIRKRDTKL